MTQKSFAPAAPIIPITCLPYIYFSLCQDLTYVLVTYSSISWAVKDNGRWGTFIRNEYSDYYTFKNFDLQKILKDPY